MRLNNVNIEVTPDGQVTLMGRSNHGWGDARREVQLTQLPPESAEKLRSAMRLMGAQAR